MNHDYLNRILEGYKKGHFMEMNLGIVAEQARTTESEFLGWCYENGLKIALKPQVFKKAKRLLS